MSFQSRSDPTKAKGDDATGTRDLPPDRTGEMPARVSWKSIASSVVALAIAGSVASALFFDPDDQSEQRTTQPAATEHGLACPFLEQAARFYDSGDRPGFKSAIARAANIAEGALQTSGQPFGKPERLALELQQAARSHIADLLVQAEKACSSSG
jgi:hypothetical protein